jgi:hypothetical protein
VYVCVCIHMYIECEIERFHVFKLACLCVFFVVKDVYACNECVVCVSVRSGPHMCISASQKKLQCMLVHAQQPVCTTASACTGPMHAV